MKLSAEQIRLYLLPEVEERIRHYTRLAAGEVSGLGTVEEFDGGFLVTDLYLPKQACTPAGTELDQEAVATLMLELDNSGKDPGGLRFWWHSHADMNTFWSKTDEQCIENLANGDYVLSLVTNKRGSMLARLDIFRPVRVTLDDIPVGVRTRDLGLLESCRKELLERVNDSPIPFWAPGSHPMAPRREVFLTEPTSDLGPVPDIDELDEQYLAGELAWEEYMDRVERGGRNG
ncbi:MAG: hypothetical protein FJ109_17380 [Deltaproteobacteria bacterium]|nr:hypothetical protein [Deltaproteobacteria bacterium]